MMREREESRKRRPQLRLEKKGFSGIETVDH